MLRRKGTQRTIYLCAALMTWFGATSAFADVIDGDWCLGTSHFSIDGPNIQTPAGNRVQGNYSRHGFSYVVPANETGGGSEITMVLLNEENVRLTRAGQSASPEIWRRCRPIS
jgi:hypothetical protein